MDIAKFFENGERECKEAADNLPRDLWETYSAFANTRGGTIYLGIKEKNGKFPAITTDNLFLFILLPPFSFSFFIRYISFFLYSLALRNYLFFHSFIVRSADHHTPKTQTQNLN